MSMNQYIIPTQNATEDSRIGWLKEAVREGETFIRTQSASSDFKLAKDIIAGVNTRKMPDSLSAINVNLQKRLIRDIVGTLSNIRPMWGYSTDNKELEDNAEILNKLLNSWYLGSFADRSIKKCLQYSATMGTGWIGPDWNSQFWTRGRGDIVLKVNSPEDILPCQLPNDNDIQRAYAATIREQTPINLARAMFPTMAGKIHPDRSAPTGLRRGLGKMATFLSPVLNRFAADTKAKKAVDSVFPVVDIYQTYIMDMTINEGPDPVVMGEAGTYWNYTVPVLGSMIPDGKNLQGDQLYRKAMPEDCMLYPFRRLVTWCNSGILRDGPSFWWHGMFPRIPISIDEWAWDFLGYSMTRDLASIETDSNEIRRAVSDSTKARLRPALQYDDRSISQSMMESLDVRQPGQAVGVDMTGGAQQITPILPAEYYNVPAFIFQVLEKNDETMKYISGVNDFTSITKAQQMPSSDSIEKILEMSGPMVTDMSRNMESRLGGLGEMIKGMFFEFYTAPRRLQRLGKNGITVEDGDYFEPGTLVPSHMPDEERNNPSKYSSVERARRWMNSFFFKITPNSMHAITQMSRKLLYIQVQKAGQPIDPWTMAEVLDIGNFGAPPDGAVTVMQKWVAFERMKGELTASIQAKSQDIIMTEQLKMQMKQIALQAMAQQAQGGPGSGGPGGASDQAPPGGPAPDQGGAPGGAPGGQPSSGGSLPQASYSPALGNNPPGRPAQFAGNPVIASKDGGTRSTITSHK